MQAKLDDVLLQLSILAGRIERIEARLSQHEPPAPNNVLALSKQSSEIVAAASDRAYEQVMAELSEHVFPEMNKLAQIVQYQAQDSDGMVDAYRRAVESREDISGRITDGKSDPRVISPYVRLFF